MPRLLIVSGTPETAAHYRTAMEQRGAACEMTHSVADMFEILLRIPFNGLVLDVPTAIKATEKEKALLQDLSDVYPTLRVRWDARAGQIRGLLLGQTLNGADPVGDFMDRFCRSRPARTCRKNKRYQLHFNALLSSEETVREGRAEKVFTVDISEGGCYLFSSRSWENRDVAWVRFIELSDPTPIRLEVRRCVRWGEGLQIPGIGAQFSEIPPGQLQELRAYLAGR